MNQKHYLLLTLFTSFQISFSYQELESRFGIGERALRKYISEINDFLSKKNFPQIEALPDKTLCLRCTPKDRQSILQESYDYNLFQYHFSSNEREVIIKLLLLSRDRITSSDIIQELAISKKTCFSDMQNVIYYFSKENIVCQTSNQGYYLDIPERLRLEYIIQIVYDRLGTSNGYLYTSGIDVWITRHFQLKQYLADIEPMLIAWQNDNSIYLEGYQFQQLSLALAILIKRIYDKNIFEKEDVTSCTRNLEYAVSLSSHLATRFSKLSNYSAAGNILTVLDTVLVNPNSNDHFESIPANVVIRSFLVGISKELGFDLADDELLYKRLLSHIKRILSHFQKSKLNSFIISNELKEEYPQIFNAVENNIFILEHSFHYKYGAEDITLLVLHITATIEQILSEKREIRIIVVCNSGTAAATYISEKLKSHCRIDVVQSVSSYKLSELLDHIEQMPDLIVSVVPIEENRVPVVFITPSLNHSDLLSIQEKLTECSNRKDLNFPMLAMSDPVRITGFNVLLSQVFSPNHILLDYPAETWQDSIHAAGNLLLKDGIIDEEYIKAMIDNVKTNGPYIVFFPGIALAHALPPSKSLPLSASMVRLKEPIPFGHDQNDPVRYVIAFASADIQENEEKIIAVINMASNALLFNQLDSLTSSGDVYLTISRQGYR